MISMTENIISFGDAGKVVPGRPHPATVARWALRGRKGIRLESLVVGGRRFTSVEALERFFARLSAFGTKEVIPQRITSSQHIKSVERQLDDAGL